MCRPVACGEADQLRVGLADELDGEAEQAVEEDEGADELARLVAGLGLPEHPPEDDEQDDALQQRLVKLASGGAAGPSAVRPAMTSGKRTAQGTLVGAPHSSWFTKLARRPKNRPNGTQQAT